MVNVVGASAFRGREPVHFRIHLSQTFMFALSPVLNRWIYPQGSDSSKRGLSALSGGVYQGDFAAEQPMDLPSEIWTLIFQEASLRRRDLYAVLMSCRFFNQLIIPVLLYNFSGTSPSSLAAGEVDMTSDMVPMLNLAAHLPFIGRLTLTFDIRGESKAPTELLALKTLVSRTSFLVDLRLNFLGDLLSAYKSDLTPLAPQRAMTESFCDLLSAIPDNTDDPVVFVSTEVFTCRASDIRGWQLNKYMFTDAGTGGGLLGLLSGMQAYIRPQARNPLRTKTSVKQHNGLHAAVFPFISISSVHIQRLPGPFSAELSSWTLVHLNAGSPHWPNALNLSAPLAGEEWAAILPLLAFPKLPLVRMDLPRGDGIPNIPAPVLDAFLGRHPHITRMYYYPDPSTFHDAPAFPYTSLPRMRNITTTARGALHLFHSPEDAFPNLFIVCINGVNDPGVITEAFRLLARHGGSNKLILEVSSGSWMDKPSSADAAVVSTLHHVDTVILSGFTDLVDGDVILAWIRLFPALRRVGLQSCLHDAVGLEGQKDFPRRAREALPRSIELISS
ncbi:hypothetical protein C8F04DRAFT_694977 [Mycena alexandri]|uniref:F-box domain-containing protein n=1 Tax=Mycena alexandri TaxID=1745969 RepID=A0AAD6X1Q8_9AGAR|nr:hypothetical protein C8F04DRAFT_694977 [Mycena alexandri]